jgi:hypothetical protein
MEDPIEYLNERDDVKKTEYTRVGSDSGRIKIELWHDVTGLKRLFDRAIQGNTSEKGLRKFAEDCALVKRETDIAEPVLWRELDELYPEVTDRLGE